jgi:hypothetical protein
MDAAIVILTAALVLTTAVYSYFTWRMANEMQKTREQTLRPRLSLYVRAYGPMGGFVALRSLGPGAALDVLVTLSFEPSGETREWRTPVFRPATKLSSSSQKTRPRGFLTSSSLSSTEYKCA